MCFDKLTSTCKFNTSGNCCKGLLEENIINNPDTVNTPEFGKKLFDMMTLEDKKDCSCDKLTVEQKKIIALMHLEVCGACGKETLHVDVLGGEKKCINCNGRFRNRRAE